MLVSPWPRGVQVMERLLSEHSAVGEVLGEKACHKPFEEHGHVPNFQRRVRDGENRRGRPANLQTEDSTAATHRPGKTEKGDNGQGRLFNKAYLKFVEHFGLKPRTIGIGKKALEERVPFDCKKRTYGDGHTMVWEMGQHNSGFYLFQRATTGMTQLRLEKRRAPLEALLESR